MESKVSRPLHSNTKIEQLLRDAGEHPVGGTREPIHALLENVSTASLSDPLSRNDAKAQKNGAHRSVYWVKKKKR